MKRLVAMAIGTLLSAPAFAQAPQPELGRNYKGLPFVYEPLARTVKQPQVRVIDPERQVRLQPCEDAMKRELRRSGLAENGKAVYRACAERLGLPDAAPKPPGVEPAR